MVIDAFRMIALGRRYIATMDKPIARPLSLKEINPYLDRFEPPLPAHDFVRVVMAVDSVAMEQ